MRTSLRLKFGNNVEMRTLPPYASELCIKAHNGEVMPGEEWQKLIDLRLAYQTDDYFELTPEGSSYAQYHISKIFKK